MMPNPLVGVVMGSSSDWETMRHAVEQLTNPRRGRKLGPFTCLRETPEAARELALEIREGLREEMPPTRRQAAAR